MKVFSFFLFLMCMWFESYSSFAKELPIVVIQAPSILSVHIQSSKEWKIQPSDIQKEVKKNHLLLMPNKDSKIVIQTPPKEIRIVTESIQKLSVDGLENVVLKVSTKSGKIHIQNSKGLFQVNLNAGEFLFEKSQGSLEVHSYSAPVQISHSKGSVQILSYLASVKVEKSEMDVDVNSFSSPLYFFDTAGDLKFNSDKSKVRLKRHKGSVTGSLNTGDVTGSFTPTKAYIQTVSGQIRLYFQSSKAQVEAQSWEGKVLVPKYFYKDRAGGVYKAYGRIKDRGDQMGQVSLKSTAGNISIF